MRNRDKLGLGIIAGLAAGAAAGYWLNSNRGRQWRDETSTKVNDMAADARERMDESISNVSTRVQTAVDHGKDYAESVIERVRGTIRRAEDELDEAESSLERGAKKAKKTMKAKAGKAREVVDN